jgi:hypothetical protein
MSEKITGYSLIAVGLILILFSAFSVYGVFANDARPIQFFNLSNSSLTVPLPTDQQVAPGAKPQTVDIELADVLPFEALNKPLNALAHLVLMAFLGSVGLKIATIGVMLVRPIKVNLKQAKAS